MVLRPRLRPLLPTLLLPDQLAAGAGGHIYTISTISEHLIIQGREYELLTSAVAVADLSRSLLIHIDNQKCIYLLILIHPRLQFRQVLADWPGLRAAAGRGHGGRGAEAGAHRAVPHAHPGGQGDHTDHLDIPDPCPLLLQVYAELTVTCLEEDSFLIVTGGGSELHDLRRLREVTCRIST